MLENRIEGYEVNLLGLYSSSIAAFISLLLWKDVMRRVGISLVYGVLRYILA